MIVLTLLAIFFLAVSAFMFFGVPYLLLGRAGLSFVVGKRDARSILGGLALACVVTAMTPLSYAALINSGETAIYFAATLTSLSFAV